jgi:hypothetical protein
MKKIAILFTGLFYCQPAAAIEVLVSQFSVDNYRLYFEIHLTDLPPDVVGFNLYAESTCAILPPSHERFRFTFNADGGPVIEDPEVTTTGTPALDRWADGLTDHLSLEQIDFGNWIINGSIPNGSQPFHPGDSLCMRIDVPGAGHIYSGLPITATPEATIHLQKSSTTQFVTQVGQVVPYSYRVENTSSVFIHDVALDDDNVDEPPFCEFEGNDELAPEGQPRSVVFCTAEHTVTQDEIDNESGISNTVTVTADELDSVTQSLHIPVGVFRSGFESPPNTITIVERSASSHHDIAIGADGKPLIAFFDVDTDNLKVAKCLDVHCTAVSLSSVDSSANRVGLHPSIAIGNDLLPVIAYQDETDGVLFVAKCNDDACQGGDELISWVDDGGAGQYASIAIGDDGMPTISYGSQADEKLRVASCNDPACSGGDEIVTELNDPGTGGSLNTSIAIGDDGFPVISYQRFTSPWEGVLKVAKCNDASCVGGDETITTLDTTGGPGFESTSLAIGDDGHPVIAYMDTAADAITVAKCNDPACAGGDETFTAIDFSTTYMHLSMTLGADGNPVISYLGSLNVATCNDPACIGENESIATVDKDAEARSSSIAIGVDGLPVISYWDGITGDLKVAHCGTPSCVVVR